MLVIKNPPANAGDIRDKCSILGSGRFPGEGNATHSSILAWRIPRTEEAWQATVCGVIKSQIQLKWLSKIQKQPKYLQHTHTHIHTYIMEYYSTIKKGWNAVFCNSLEGPPEYYAWWSKANDSIFFCYLIKCNSMPCPCLSFSIGFKISSFSLHDFFSLTSNFLSALSSSLWTIFILMLATLEIHLQPLTLSPGIKESVEGQSFPNTQPRQDLLPRETAITMHSNG